MRKLISVALCAVFGCVGADVSTLELPELYEAPELTDLNPDPNIVEVRLVAGVSTTEYLAGKQTEVWAYRDGALADGRGTVPGPMLKAKLGDQIIVHFKNELPDMETTVHWHGLRLPAQFDGAPSFQMPAIRAGGEFEYRFVARDASTFWYHPHMRANEQMERGLYAAMLVEGDVVPDVAADRYIILDDVKINSDGSLNEDTTELDRMMGRQGNVLLVNGRRAPVQLRAAAKSRERWRIVNAANGRYFNLQIPGAVFLVIAGDGGLLPQPYPTETLLVTPGERYDVLVTFDERAGGSPVLQTVHYDRGHELPDQGPQELMRISLGPPGDAPKPLPLSWPALSRLDVSATTPVRLFVLEEYAQPGFPVVFTINGERWPDNQHVRVKQGATEIWEVRNTAPMDHPFHLHGMFFQVLDNEGRARTRDGWKDTVNIPQRASVRFAVQYEPLGMWMFHCHILEHAEFGMMGELMVMP
jgi:FtsP/CotA-like multicopper oxidase with cupredoxin domain